MASVDPTVKNLIFDLGGVILDLAIDDTLRSFAGLAGVEMPVIHSWYNSAPEFITYEMGGCSDAEFRAFLNGYFPTPNSDEAIDQSWNMMLRGLPKQKLDLILSLKNKYNVFLLSNTNAIHVKHMHDVMLPAVPGALPRLDDYFHRAYYSHIMKKRKPNANIFEEVLRESGLKAHETLFLDDNYDNIVGAGKVGIKTAHVNTPDYILTYFNEGR
jgi:FMN phosphatase YigB (HAD superfamily)